MKIKFYDKDRLIVSVDMNNGEYIKDKDGYTIFTGKRVPALYRGTKQVKYDRVECERCQILAFTIWTVSRV